jgi:hypothetical protein
MWQARMMGRFSLTEQRWIATGTIILAVLFVALASPAGPDTVDVDHAAHAATLATMGEVGYHQAMNDAMVVRDGGPSGSVRAFRLPTMFWIWSTLPDIYWTYVPLLMMVMIALAWLIARPLVAPAIALYLIVQAYPHLDDRGWQAQWLTVELWAVLPALGAVALWHRRHDLPAAALATCAAFLREHLALLVVGGAVQAWREQRRVWPWLVGLVSFAGYYLWHAARSLPFVAEIGFEQALFGRGAISHVGLMAGFGLPASVVFGPLLVGIALWRSGRGLMTVGLLLLPLAGLITSRPYWGLMVVPVAMLVAVEGRGQGPHHHVALWGESGGRRLAPLDQRSRPNPR